MMRRDTTTYADADRQLHRGNKPVDSRKVGNNTYLQRRADGSIAVRLHETDVVTFHADGTLTLNTGGWFTVTTKDRLNQWLPAPFSVYSVRGSWHVILSWRTVRHEHRYGPTSYRIPSGKYRYWPSGVSRWDSRVPDKSVPFFDGLRLDIARQRPVGRVPNAKARDKRNAKTRAAIKRYVALYTDAQIATFVDHLGEVNGDCLFCQFGDSVSGTDHLRKHLTQKYVMLSVAYNAVKAKGYRDPAFILQVSPDAVRKAISTYLRKRLLESVQVTH